MRLPSWLIMFKVFQSVFTCWSTGVWIKQNDPLRLHLKKNKKTETPVNHPECEPCVCVSHRCALPQEAGLLHPAGPSELLHVLTEVTLSTLGPHAGLAAPAPGPPAPRPPTQRLTARHPRTSQLQNQRQMGSTEVKGQTVSVWHHRDKTVREVLEKDPEKTKMAAWGRAAIFVWVGDQRWSHTHTKGWFLSFEHKCVQLCKCVCVCVSLPGAVLVAIQNVTSR